jgi:hypothetical protein
VGWLFEQSVARFVCGPENSVESGGSPKPARRRIMLAILGAAEDSLLGALAPILSEAFGAEIDVATRLHYPRTRTTPHATSIYRPRYSMHLLGTSNPNGSACLA